MRVILREDLANLGKTGDVVKVTDGYARNYLLPRRFAVQATEGNMKQIEHEQRSALSRRDKLLKEAGTLRAKLEGVSVTVPKRVGEGERLFGSVTAHDIELALAEEGHKVERKHIRIEEPIRALGVFHVKIALHGGTEASIKVWVVAK
ncbi:MAG: 50S ribosomal protein L9 [Deltaproteobacteria bacterium]|nr:50S ribosomal protein L9 [Deltaproteobacteria bacterium]